MVSHTLLSWLGEEEKAKNSNHAICSTSEGICGKYSWNLCSNATALESTLSKKVKLIFFQGKVNYNISYASVRRLT